MLEKRQGARQGMGQVDVWRQCRGGGGGIVKGGGREGVQSFEGGLFLKFAAIFVGGGYLK